MAPMVNPVARTMTRTFSFRSLPPGQRGFTLLEILLVFTLVALASIVVLPNIGELDARSFNVQSREAVALLNHARRSAVVSGRPRSVAFYSAAEDTEGLTAPERNSVGSWYGADIGLRFRGSTEQEPSPRDYLSISFFPEGGSTGGTLLLADNDQSYRIDIDPFTGRISTGDRDED